MQSALLRGIHAMSFYSRSACAEQSLLHQQQLFQIACWAAPALPAMHAALSYRSCWLRCHCASKAFSIADCSFSRVLLLLVVHLFFLCVPHSSPVADCALLLNVPLFYPPLLAPQASRVAVEPHLPSAPALCSRWFASVSHFLPGPPIRHFCQRAAAVHAEEQQPSYCE